MIIKRLMMTAAFAGFACLGTACAAETNDTSPTTAPAVPAPTNAAADTKAGFEAPDSAWRDVDPENAILIETDYGKLVVELFPEIAPGHVERIKTLSRKGFYDFITFHRVIDGFMNQTGDPKGDGTGDSDLPDLEAEFTFRRGADMPLTLFGSRKIDPKDPNSEAVGVGFYKGLPVGTQPTSQAILTKDGKVEAFAVHCKGVTSMARSGNPNSGNSQFFLMRGTSPWLDTQYSIWGNTVYGQEHLTKFKVGTKGQDADFVPDKMNKVRVLADVPENERLQVQVLESSSPAFKSYLTQQRKSDGSYPDICDVEVPTRLKP